MLQRQQSEWAPASKPADAFDDIGPRSARLPTALTASAAGTPVLTETAVATPGTHSFTAVTLSPGDSPQTSANYADSAVTGLGFIGFWLMIVGAALLARRLRLVRSDRQNTISESAWQRQLRTAARQTPV
ncbi:MAG: hypothetical protein V4709_09520 [Pseudomonadota bacterium]